MVFPNRQRRPRPSARTWWLAAAAAALLLAGAERGVRRLAARSSPAAGAAWIWAAEAADEVAPRAFYAVREFELEAVPAAARLFVLADEEYLLFLNGRRVGSNAYTPGAPLDVYAVASLLVPGPNRLVAELRSGRGAGGFLLRLEAEAGGPALAVSDRQWRIFPRFVPGIVRQRVPLEAGSEPRVWGPPPSGRWGSPVAGAERPLFAAAVTAGPLAGTRGRRLRTEAPWPGRWVVWDWGRTVTGYLAFDFAAEAPGAALLFTGTEVPRLEPQGAAAAVISPGGSRWWIDAVPRRLRYAVVVGSGRVRAARLWPLPAPALAGLAPRLGPARGLFDLQPPVRPSVVEREVERRLAGGTSKPRR